MMEPAPEARPPCRFRAVHRPPAWRVSDERNMRTVLVIELRVLANTAEEMMLADAMR
jgi:hypothetical protein